MLMLGRVIVVMVAALTLSLPSAPAAAQGKKAAAKKGAPEKGEGKDEHAAAMEAMAKAGAPGKPHKALKAMVGSWDAAVTGWMAPGQPPMKSKAKAEKKMILGDRFLSEEFSGNMMDKPFTGMGLTGYDNMKKKYVMTWVDDMSTSIMVMEGTTDKAGKTMTATGEFIDPVSGQPKKMRSVGKIISPKKHVFEMYEVPESGKPRKTMEIVYTRK